MQKRVESALISLNFLGICRRAFLLEPRRRALPKKNKCQHRVHKEGANKLISTSRKEMTRARLPSPERRRRILASKEAWKQRNYEYYAKQHAIIKARPENRAKDRERYKRKQLEQAERTGVPVRPVGRPRLYTTTEELEARRLRINARHKAWRDRRSETQGLSVKSSASIGP